MSNLNPDNINRFPNCVRMELELKPILPKGLKGILKGLKGILKGAEQLDLVLSIRFGEHTEEIIGGKVTFGLRRGELRVNLNNGEVPLKNIKLADKFQTEIETELQEELGKEDQVGISLSDKPGFSASGKDTEKVSEKVKYLQYQFSTEGNRNSPTWIFVAVRIEEQILQGLLQETELATVDIKGKPCSVVATFGVTKLGDICLTDAEWLWVRNITKIRMAVIERAIVRNFFEDRLQQETYLSKVELSYG
jgi:hypothetical protein